MESQSHVMDIAIVTSAWGSYSRYLTHWMESIAFQTVQPRVVAVVDAGLADPGVIDDISSDLDADFRSARIEYQGMGHARNVAVELSGDTEWVMHLDADDVLFPHAIEDVQKLSHNADVVSVGALRDGKKKLFPKASAKTALKGQQVAFSCAAFRRDLWKQRPYITANDWVESALWVGFAHLGARFVPTTRPGFIYHSHPDSHSHQKTKADQRAAMHQLRSLCRKWRDI